MTAYLIIMLLLVLPAILLPQRHPSRVAWAFAYLMLLVFVGLRHKVGMDWNNYLVMAEKVEGAPLLEALSVAEPGYAALLWLSVNAGVGVYGANLVTAAIMLAGIMKFCRKSHLPWLSLVCALPMLVFVVGMSANRQAAAIGVLMWLAASWDSVGLKKRIALTLLASAFHLSALFFLVFSALGLKMRPAYKLVLVTSLSAVGLFLLQVSGGAEYYDQAYITGQSELTFSPGASQHALLNGVPALLLVFGGRFRGVLFPTPLLRHMAWMAMALIPISLFFSLAAGRMTLYLFPVSLWVFAALPGLFKDGSAKAILRALVSSVQVVVLWIWLNFANSAIAHIPYGNALAMHSWELHL